MAMQFFDPVRFGTELVYTMIVVFLFFLVYHKTKDMYNLTKHIGIKYFRHAFLFFGLSYLVRLLLHLLQLGNFAFEMFQPRGFIFPSALIFVGYFSTIAIFYLTYSIVWKKIDYKHFLLISNSIAIIVSLIAFVYRSPIILLTLQSALFLITLILSMVGHKKKKSSIRLLYFFIMAFWLINLYLLTPRRFLPFEIKLIFQIISIGVFILIYNKVTVWTR